MACCATESSVVELQNVCRATEISAVQTAENPIALQDNPVVFHVVFLTGKELKDTSLPWWDFFSFWQSEKKRERERITEAATVGTRTLILF